MTENIDEEVLNRLEAEATVADAEPEELTLMVESDVEEKESQIEELEAEVEEKESEVEELQEELDEKGEELEDMQEEIDIMSEKYAEELSQSSEVMDKEDFLERFEFEELQEKAESLETDSGSSPSPNSGDVGAGFQSPNGEGGQEDGEDIDLSQKEELAASSFRDRAKQTGKEYWAEIAEEIENGGE
jgi:DNA repair exonuclease SbcCD ATPase subunit